MNEARRKEIRRLESLLESCKPLAEQLAQKLSEAHQGYESIRDEEQDYRDNMPEGLDGSERAQVADDAIAALDEVVDGLSEHADSLESFPGVLDDLIQKSDEAKGSA